MIEKGIRRPEMVVLGVERGYNNQDFVEELQPRVREKEDLIKIVGTRELKEVFKVVARRTESHNVLKY